MFENLNTHRTTSSCACCSSVMQGGTANYLKWPKAYRFTLVRLLITSAYTYLNTLLLSSLKKTINFVLYNNLHYNVVTTRKTSYKYFKYLR
jgi:hypothetical protein